MSASVMHQFATGATRSGEDEKIDPKGFISPFWLLRFSQYMKKHQTQLDGDQRASDNWQKGMDIPRYRRSLIRHFLDLWTIFYGGIVLDDHGNEVDEEEILCALQFNLQGEGHELLRARGYRGMEQLKNAKPAPPGEDSQGTVSLYADDEGGDR